MPDAAPHREQSQPWQLLIATAGHVDHGKTSLIKHLTGTDTDTLKEEKLRGLTINPGFAYHHFAHPESPDRSFTLGFVDCPGHADFIPNMLAGVGSVAQALLLVACDDGIMPQTREHLDILRLLGIQQITVVLSKMDRANGETIELLKSELHNLLEAQQFPPAEFFAVNNISGEGAGDVRQHLERLAMAADSGLAGQQGRQTRFLIDRCFSVKGIGTVVTGTLRSGRLDCHSELVASGNGEAVRVREIQLDRADLAHLEAGQRAALKLNIGHQALARGDWLLAPAAYLPCYRLDVELSLLDTELKVKPGTQYHLYLGASHHVVTVHELDRSRKLYQLRATEAMHAHHGDRFVLRDPAARTTIGGGSVIDILVPHKGRYQQRTGNRNSEARQRELQIKSGPAASALAGLVNFAPMGVNLDNFAKNFNLLPGTVEQLVKELADDTVRIKPDSSGMGMLFSRQHNDRLIKALLETVDRFHQDHRSVEGVGVDQLRHLLRLKTVGGYEGYEGSAGLLETCIEQLLRQKKLKRSGSLLSAFGHRARRSPEEEQFLRQIKPLLEAAGTLAPRTRELVAATGIPLNRLEKLLRECVKSGLLVQVANNRFYLPETIAELAGLTEQLAQDAGGDGGFTVIQFRDASGIGRNLCIEILEYFDSIGFTRREENLRFLRMSRAEKFG